MFLSRRIGDACNSTFAFNYTNYFNYLDYSNYLDYLNYSNYSNYSNYFNYFFIHGKQACERPHIMA